VRYYWIIARGYRLRRGLRPTFSAHGTFFGKEASGLDARKFFGLMWRERARIERFLEWVAIRPGAQNS